MARLRIGTDERINRRAEREREEKEEVLGSAKK
jgi:hypothetical protein